MKIYPLKIVRLFSLSEHVSFASYRDDGHHLIASRNPDHLSFFKQKIKSTFEKYSLDLKFEQQIDSASEEKSRLEYLDVQFYNKNGSLKYTLFRKPQTVQKFIPLNSAHAKGHLDAVGKSEVIRIARRSSEFIDFKDSIKQTCDLLGERIDADLITENSYEKIHQELHLPKLELGRPEKKQRKKLYIVLSYSPYTIAAGKIFWKHFKEILMKNQECSKIFKHRIRLVFKNVHPNLNTLIVARNQKILQLNSNPLVPEPSEICVCTKTELGLKSTKNLHADGSCSKKGIIYRYDCSSCDFSYIGSTNQKCISRFKQHTKISAKNTSSSTIGQHIINNPKHEGCFKILEHFKQNDVSGLDCRLCSAEGLHQIWDRGNNKILDVTYGCLHKKAFNLKRTTDICTSIIERHKKYKASKYNSHENG